MAKPNTTINRVVELKMTHEDGASLHPAFDRVFQSTRAFFNEVPTWGMDHVLCGTQAGVERQVPTPTLPTLYLKRTDHSLSTEKLQLLTRFLFVLLTHVTMARSLGPILQAASRDTESMRDEDWASVRHFLANASDMSAAAMGDYITNKDVNNQGHLFYRVVNTLRAIGFLGGDTWGQESLTPDERYCVMENVSRGLRSWFDRNEDAIKTFDAEAQVIDEELACLSSDQRKAFEHLIDLWVEHDWIRHCDGRVKSYVRDCLIPAFEGGAKPEKGFYLKGDETREFSLHPDFVASLYDSNLWCDGLIVAHMETIDRILTHKQHQRGAKYPFIGPDDTHRVPYLLGSNYVTYALTAEGTGLPGTVDLQEDDKVLQFENGVAVNKLVLAVGPKSAPTRFRVHHQMTYHSGKPKPGSYFADLHVWQRPRNLHTLLQWTRKGERVVAVLKEPSVTFKHGNFFVRLNLTVPVDSAEQFKLKNHLQRAWTPEVKDQSLVGKHFRAMGVDLGVRNTYAYTVLESTVGCEGETLIARGKTPRLGDDTLRRYQEVLNDVKDVITAYRVIPILAKGADVREQQLDRVAGVLRKAQVYLGGRISIVGASRSGIYRTFAADTNPWATFCSQVKGVELSSLLTNRVFYGKLLTRYARHRMAELSVERRNHFNRGGVVTKFAHDLPFMEILEALKRMSRAVASLGLPPRKFGEGIETPELNRRLKNVRDNFRRQTAARLVERAVEHKCDVIVMEALKGYSMDLNSRDENKLKALWSPQEMRKVIENAAAWHGIQVAEVDEAHTTQIHAESRVFGFVPTPREIKVAKENGVQLSASFFYYLADGCARKIDNDVNASQNIALRAIRQHTDVRRISRRQLDLLSTRSNGEIPKRLAGVLTYHFGGVKAGTKALSSKLTQGPDDLYLRAKGEWVPGKAFNAERKRLSSSIITGELPIA